MVRKIFVFAFLLLANIVMLVHTIIPHHHHRDRICFDLAGFSINHSFSGGPDSHDACCNPGQDATDNNTGQSPCGQEDPNCCHLSDVMVFHPESHRDEIACKEIELNRIQGHYQFFIIQASYTVPDITVWQLPFRQMPFPDSNYCIVTSSAHGLRAPPAC